jgi:6-phosphogluconolactonase (cycloisomerase 2 family)
MSDEKGMWGAVYTQSNDAERNEVIAYRRDADGSLAPAGRHETGGRGNGTPHLPSQGSVALSRDGRWLLVTNAGSDELSLLAVGSDGLELSDRAGSGGRRPTSVAVHGDLAYVLNAGGDGEAANVTGFRIGSDGRLSALAGSARPLSRPDADPAQVGFSPDGRVLVVTERATDAISVYTVDGDGFADAPTTHASSGQTPYGFDFTTDGALVVTEAAGARIGAASASSYVLADGGLTPVSGPVGNTHSEVCWAVVSRDGRFAWVTNFGDGTISSYRIGPEGAIELHDPAAAVTVEGEKGVRDEALSGDGRFLYALDADAGRVFGWRVGDDGSLEPVGSFDGVPATVAGLAAD